MFDPNAPIEGFEENIPVTEEPIEKTSKKEYKGSFKDLKDFIYKSESPKENTFSFTVKQAHLKEATRFVLLSSQPKLTPNPLRLTLSSDNLKIASFNPYSFTEYMIPVTTSYKNKTPLRFIFDLNILYKIASTFTEESIEFLLDPAKSLCTIKAGRTNLEISLYPDTEFIDFGNRISQQKYLASISPVALRQAIVFIYPFSAKDDLQPNFSLIEVRNGMALGGTSVSLLTMTSPRFQGYSIKLRYELLTSLEKALQFLDEQNTALFESETHYVIRDGNSLFGFEKTPHSFIDITPILNAPKSGRRLVIPRDILQNTLRRLSVVSLDKKLPVTVTYKGINNDATMTLVTEDQAGKQSRDTIQISVKDENNTDPNLEHRFKVTLDSLLKTVGFHDNPNIEIYEIENKALFLEDKFEGDTYLTVLTILK